MNCNNSKYAEKFTTRLAFSLALACLTVLFITNSVWATDWTTYMFDNARSGVTGESLTLDDLSLSWVYSAPSPPRRAWSDGPPWDAWSYTSQVPMRDFDSAIFVTIVGQDVFFGSSLTNAVHCLDISTGQQKWFYLTNGAVRLPPSYDNGKLYFGSDDGYVYCINASDGSFNWKYSPTGDTRVFFNNGNLITMWPIRSGTAVLDGKVYFAASLVPWKTSYLCSVDAGTGSAGGTGLYKADTGSGVTPVGAILASSSNLYLPQGRLYPRVYNRNNGSYSGTMSGDGGGVYALLTSDGPSTGFIYGQGRSGDKSGYALSAFSDKLASHPNGKYMVVSGGYSYVVTETLSIETTKGYQTNFVTRLKAINRDTQNEDWSVVCDNRYYSLISAGNMIFTGGKGKVYAHSKTDGSVLWSKVVEGNVRGLAAANERLFVSTDTGRIYTFGDSYLPGDLNKNGIVDLVDLFQFLKDYLDCTDPINPVNCDNLLSSN
jgi:outer membrane protein assembly factor BamB